MQRRNRAARTAEGGLPQALAFARQRSTVPDGTHLAQARPACEETEPRLIRVPVTRSRNLGIGAEFVRRGDGDFTGDSGHGLSSQSTQPPLGFGVEEVERI